MCIKTILSVFLILTHNLVNGALITNQQSTPFHTNIHEYMEYAIAKRTTRNNPDSPSTQCTSGQFAPGDFTKYGITLPEQKLLIKHFEDRLPPFNKNGFEELAGKQLRQLKQKDPEKFAQLVTGVLNFHALKTNQSLPFSTSVSSTTMFLHNTADLQAAQTDHQPSPVPANTPTRPHIGNPEQLDADFLSYMWQELVIKANTSNRSNRNKFIFAAITSALQLFVWPAVYSTKKSS